MAIYLSRQKGSGSATSITPSNASPVALVANNAVKPTTAGYAIENYDDVTPTAFPENVSSGDIVKIGGSGMVIAPTSITPSNTTPDTLTSGNVYQASASGYAIESYDSITPSSTPESVSSGDIVKIGGSGVIVDSVLPAPTSITPSNSSPASMTSGNVYQPTTNGVAIESITNIQPSTTSPVSLSADVPVNPTLSGYAIREYTPRSASDISPPYLYNNNMYLVVNSSNGGYLYETKQPNFMSPDKTQLISSSTGGTTNISVTQKPRYIVMATWNAAGSQYGGMLGIVDVTNSTAKRMGYSSSAISWTDWSAYNTYFTSITSSTVTYKSNWSTNTATRSMILIYY